jgi:Na+/H+ antiporter NhaD/arsenite permease-like protein
MLVARTILAALALAVLAWKPRSGRCALLVVAAALLDLALGATLGSALGTVAPLTVFLASALTLAALVAHSGLAARAAHELAARAGGSATRLYWHVCGLCALLTAAVSLDGAVVLMVPLLLLLRRRWGAPLRPLFLGVVAVANSFSLALPQGNPTNLVLIDRLRLSPGDFALRMLVPAAAATLLCAGAVALAERRALRAHCRDVARPAASLSGAERYAALALAFAALVAWCAPLFGIAPWWPFAAAVAAALAIGRQRPRPIVPWRTAAQVGGLLILIEGADIHAPHALALGLLGLLAIAAAVGAASALANNLPISVTASALLTTVSAGYAASIGLAVGALATPQGSLATLLAQELAGDDAPPLSVRLFAPLAALAVVLATTLLWAGL